MAVLSVVRIDSVTPRGGGGDIPVRVVVLGTGFGVATGQVVFDPLSAHGGPFSAPIAVWQDDRVEFDVPSQVSTASTDNRFYLVLLEKAGAVDSTTFQFWVPISGTIDPVSLPAGLGYQVPKFEEGPDQDTDDPQIMSAADVNRMLDKLLEQMNPDTVSQAEAEAGTNTTDRLWTAERVSQAIAALGGGGGGAAAPQLFTAVVPISSTSLVSVALGFPIVLLDMEIGVAPLTDNDRTAYTRIRATWTADGVPNLNSEFFVDGGPAPGSLLKFNEASFLFQATGAPAGAGIGQLFFTLARNGNNLEIQPTLNSWANNAVNFSILAWQ